MMANRVTTRAALDRDCSVTDVVAHNNGEGIQVRHVDSASVSIVLCFHV